MGAVEPHDVQDGEMESTLASGVIGAVCPRCGAEMLLDGSSSACDACGRSFACDSNFYDLVDDTRNSSECRHYEGVYWQDRGDADCDSIEADWHRDDRPENELVLAHVGDPAGKRILLIGNGGSRKELFFLEGAPEVLVYSDLSTNAVESAREYVGRRELEGRVRFAVVDAMMLPFPPCSFDVVYGYAVVHHMPDVRRFIDGVMRVLAPGGTAVFMDDGYSPAWQASKRTWLSPLVRWSHKRKGVSPEDLRFSMSGGFREEELRELIRQAGGEPFFERTSLLTYLFYRFSEKLLPARVDQTLRARPVARTVRWVDRQLERVAAVRRNQIRLVWGLRKNSNGRDARRTPREGGVPLC